MNRLTTLTGPRGEPEAGGSILAHFWGILAGILAPLLVVMVGLIAALLDARGLAESEVRLGTHLRLPVPEGLLGRSEIVQLGVLVAVTLIASIVFCAAMWLNRRTADARARRVVKELHRRVLAQSIRRAELEGAAAQRRRAEKLIGEQLPSVQAGLSQWYRSIPRSVLMLLGCVAVAVLVNVWLALLAVISGVLLWQLRGYLRRTAHNELSHWEVPRTRQRMAELVGQAPLLARLQARGLTDQTFAAELDSLYRRLAREDARRGRVWPLLFLATAVAVSVLLLGLGVNLFDADNGLSLPSALVLGLALTGAIVSVSRLGRLTGQLGQSSDASEAVYHYLRRGDEVLPSEQRVGLAGLREAVAIRNVTLTDSTGGPILSNLSLHLTPGSLVALLGTESVPTQALVELLMGFGRPASGSVQIDGIPLLDIHPQALARHVMWIEPSGPIWDGTVQENLLGGDHSIDSREVAEVLERLGVYERIQRLPDGLSTIVSPADSVLGVETTYAIGIARALLHRPPVVLVSEPPPMAEHLSQDPCLAALRSLADDGALVVVLPRRLPTLRAADRVVLLNGPRLVGEGRHSELLGDSDLYRHLNYLLFNPYRHQAVP